MSTLDIDSLRALALIAETGGITRAAKKLNLSQSAVSHKMKRLEQRLNCSLFKRSEGRLVMSAEGEKLLDYARRMTRLHDEACASLHQSDLAGELRLGITEDVTAPGMAQILSRFATSFPHVALTSRVAHTPELLRWLERGEVDMALIEVFESEQLASDYALGRQQVVWLLAEDFVLDEDRPLAYVAYHRDCFYKAWAERALAELGRSLRVVFEWPSLDGPLPRRHGSPAWGLRIERTLLPQAPAIQHVARFSAGMPTRQMDKLLELIMQELQQVS